MESMPYSQLEKGALLIATPDIEGGLFFRSVILLCEHTQKGSFGIVINKTLDIDLPEEIIKSGELSNPHVGMRAGGPVQTNQMMLLHSCSDIPQQTLQICDGVYLGGDLQFLHSIVEREDQPYVYLCFGYSGWGAGQLEREFLDGHWFLHKSSIGHVFHTDPTKLWQRLLRDMGGKYATLSMIPEDLSLN